MTTKLSLSYLRSQKIISLELSSIATVCQEKILKDKLQVSDTKILKLS